MKYFLVGLYPPPLGGVSIFNYRYARLLRERGYDVECIDVSRKKISRIDHLKFKIGCYLKLVFWPHPAVYHLDHLDFQAALLILIRPFKSRVILHTHSRPPFESMTKLQLGVFSLFLRKVDECLFVGPHLAESYQRHGLKLPTDQKIESPFLPPPAEDEDEIRRQYDEATLSFIAQHRPLIIANASEITFQNGIDLYGLDMCVSLIEQIKEAYPNIGLLFALPKIGDQAYFEEINRRIRNNGIEENIHFMTGQKELWPLFKNADLMLRPTCSDGYGISIAEALYLDCAAIASDVCERPEGTVLFKSRDADDLLSKVRSVLERVLEGAFEK